MGVYITTKLNWRLSIRIENLIIKARKRLIFFFFFLNITQSWSQDTKTLLYLSISLVRLKSIYGQEVYFSAPNTLLKKLQSIDSKAIKLAIGVPVHINTSKTVIIKYVRYLMTERGSCIFSLHLHYCIACSIMFLYL